MSPKLRFIKKIASIIVCLLALGFCGALCHCSNAKPNVLKTQQRTAIKREYNRQLESNIEYGVDVDLTYYSTFYFMRIDAMNVYATFELTDSDDRRYTLSIPTNYDYQIIIFYNVFHDTHNWYYYDTYYYSDSNMNVISLQNEITSVFDTEIMKIKVGDAYSGFNGYVGGFLEDSGDANSLMGEELEADQASQFYATEYLEAVRPHLLGNAMATIQQLQYDLQDAIRTQNGLQLQVEGLTERLETAQQLNEELGQEIERLNVVVDNLQELNNLPTHLGGWFELVINLLQNLWNMELLPHIKLGYFIALPILFTLISIVLKLVRGA